MVKGRSAGRRGTPQRPKLLGWSPVHEACWHSNILNPTGPEIKKVRELQGAGHMHQLLAVRNYLGEQLAKVAEAENNKKKDFLERMNILEVRAYLEGVETKEKETNAPPPYQEIVRESHARAHVSRIDKPMTPDEAKAAAAALEKCRQLTAEEQAKADAAVAAAQHAREQAFAAEKKSVMDKVLKEAEKVRLETKEALQKKKKVEEQHKDVLTNTHFQERMLADLQREVMLARQTLQMLKPPSSEVSDDGNKKREASPSKQSSKARTVLLTCPLHGSMGYRHGKAPQRCPSCNGPWQQPEHEVEDKKDEQSSSSSSSPTIQSRPEQSKFVGPGAVTINEKATAASLKWPSDSDEDLESFDQ